MFDHKLRFVVVAVVFGCCVCVNICVRMYVRSTTYFFIFNLIQRFAVEHLISLKTFSLCVLSDGRDMT